MDTQHDIPAQGGEKKRNWKVISAITALVLVLAALFIIPNLGGNTKAAADTQDTTQALRNLLTVKTAKFDCVQLVNATGGNTMAYNGKTLIGLKVDALKGTPPRKWSDAISTPLPGQGPKDKLRNLQSAICQDPLLGVTTANMLAGLTVDGVKVGDLNNWLKPYAVNASEINNKAAGFIPLLDATTPSDEELEKAAAANLDYQELAAKLNTLLTRFHLDGIQSPRSVRNWHLAGGGLSVGGLPEVALNKHQENLPALVLSVRLKDVCVPASLIGFNVGDKRPEVFGATPCGDKPKDKPKSPTPTPQDCKDKGNCPPPTTCVKDCEPTPTPTPCPPGTVKYEDRCVKPPSDDGVGGNDSPTSQPVGENPQGPTQGVTTPPPPPNPGPAPTPNSPAPAPTPGGYNSGEEDGSGTPGGSTCDSSGCDGGGSTPPSPGTPPVVDDDTHTGDPGGF